jgi:hypothetical protein
MAWMVFNRLLRSQHRTLNVSEADIFFIPAWGNGAGKVKVVVF